MNKHSNFPSKIRQDGKEFYLELLKEFPDSINWDEKKQRLLERVQEHGARTLNDRELISLLFCDRFRTEQIENVLDELFAKFDSFHGIISATSIRLKEVTGLNGRDISNINVAKEIAERLLKTKLVGKKIIHSEEDIIDHLMIDLSCLDKICVKIIFLNKIGRIISSEIFQTGTVDHVTIYLRELFSRALTLNASRIIYVRNDPAGITHFSQSDINSSKEIIRVGASLGIGLFDYLIIGQNNYASMKYSKLI